MGLLCTVLHNPELKPGTIPPKIHDLYNKDIDMRKLERQLRVLPDLLNSCPDIVSKVTRVRTLANMLAAAPLASSMLSEVDKLVRIYLTIPITTATGERSLSAVRCIKTYLRSAAPQQHNAPQCPQGSDGRIGFGFAHRCQTVRPMASQGDGVVHDAPGDFYDLQDLISVG